MINGRLQRVYKCRNHGVEFDPKVGKPINHKPKALLLPLLLCAIQWLTNGSRVYQQMEMEYG